MSAAPKGIASVRLTSWQNKTASRITRLCMSKKSLLFNCKKAFFDRLSSAKINFAGDFSVNKNRAASYKCGSPKSIFSSDKRQRTVTLVVQRRVKVRLDKILGHATAERQDIT